VSDDKVVDKKIDALLQAICKKGGLGLVTWVEHGTKNIQMEKNTGEEVRGEAEEENEKSDDKETSRKRKIKVRIDSTKKLKAPESSVSDGSIEHTEALHMKAKLEQQAKKVETLESKLEEMGKQLQSFETMKLRVGILENEFMLLKEKSKTNEMFKVPQLKDEDISTDKMFAKKAVRDRMVESDDESTVDGYPMLNTQNTQPQKSSPAKIIQPTASIAEKFIQRKVGRTLKVMGVDQPKVGREKSTRVKKLGPALQTPFRGILPNLDNNKQDNQLNIMRGRGYDPFAPVDMQKVKILDDWLQLDEEYPIGSQNNGVEFFKILRTPQDWLNEEVIVACIAMNLLRLRFMKNPKTFRSDRIVFTDTYFTVVWTRSYNEFLSAQDLPIFPNGAHDYCSGKLPSFAGTGKKWMIDVDYIYGVLFVNNNHW
ncbi:unnamed protein product, partial [Brassica oleracea]